MEIFELKERLSVNLKKLRKEKNWSQFELAEKADISEQTVNSIESRRLWPSEKTLVKITNALNADVHRLFLPESYAGLPQSELSADLRLAVVQSVRALVEKTLADYCKQDGGRT
ncbi:MAG: helix-turn-helix transcriptional regulator [Treponema sp.]|nr:helix-turn-helix transcriptional regulator [Treponema sp.]